MPTNMANDNGNCISAPIEPLDMNGKRENMVVREVIMIGIKRSCPAMEIAGISDIPWRRCTVMGSIFKIESLITIPAITIIPVIDIISIDMPRIQRIRSTKNTSTAISDRIISGCIILSNCAAKMKNNNSNATTNTHKSQTII